MPQVIPVDATLPDQTLVLTLEGVTYRWRVRWNERAAVWFSYLYDAEADLIATGAVVLDQYLYLRSVDARKPPGVLVAQDTTETLVEAGEGELGARVRVLYFTAAEVLSGLAGTLA